jgi:hypothetical protein
MVSTFLNLESPIGYTDSIAWEYLGYSLGTPTVDTEWRKSGQRVDTDEGWTKPTPMEERSLIA